MDVHGYASDITRTWAWRRGEFADLIAALDAQQQEIIEEIKPGRRYSELHLQMHHRLARLLQATELVDMSVDEMIHTGVTNVFFPMVSATSSACRCTMPVASCRMSAVLTCRPRTVPLSALHPGDGGGPGVHHRAGSLLH